MKECQHCKQCYSDTVSICPDDGMPTFHTISGEPVLDGKYKLDRRLGQGGMGVVYCARHAYLKTQHAIKVILPDLVGNDPQLVTRFRQEALAAAAIRHNNVIAVTDFGVAEGTMPFLVMEYVEGESLQDMLDREKRLSPERAIELMSAICSGVGAAHRGGIVHRDLKPLNIMIQKDRHSLSEAVKILDFGLAKIKSGELLGSFIQAQTTGLMGSPYYMAPEQWADEDPDAAADIYSLGVILFQMIAGDVPFKGSSIPAIMKKHLSDPPLSFAEAGVQVSPQLELAVRHALEKDRHKRTASTDQFIDELRSASGYSSQSLNIHTSQLPSAPVATLHILTKPPQAKVFVDGVSMGVSQPDGWMMVEGMQSGNHQLKISHDGYSDWESSIFCEGKPQQIVAELQGQEARGFETMNYHQALLPNESLNFKAPQNTQNIQSGAQQTFHQTAGSQQFNQTAVEQSSAQNLQTSQPVQHPLADPVKKGMSVATMAIIGILGVLLLSGIGIGAAFMTGLIGKTGTGTNIVNGKTPNVNTTPGNTNSATPPVTDGKNEMVKIEGGKYKMGRDDSSPMEMPAHEVSVSDFWMDKTEVTNAEYQKFVDDTGYAKFPANWVNGKPVVGEELFPVVRVNIEDVKAFAAWRSKRDSQEYRLPTEEEWEYAARNGSANNLYPWGDNYEDRRAVLEQSAPKTVGSAATGANKWGVVDLIGNVWEWTSSEFKPYPGSGGELIRKSKVPEYAIRGGGFVSKTTGDKAVTSTSRLGVEITRQDGILGFRLVRSD